MIYLSGCVRPELFSIHPRLGFMTTPHMGNHVPAEQWWAADTGCFAKPAAFRLEDYLAWLKERIYKAHTNFFATAPDVVGNAKATLDRSIPALPLIRGVGFRAALVAQDGLEDLPIPWSAFDCLFIGGSTEWKLSQAAIDLIREGKRRGKWVHAGRVNSWKRLWMMTQAGCDSADGTYLCFGPNVLLPKVLSWLRRLDASLGPVNVILPTIGAQSNDDAA